MNNLIKVTDVIVSKQLIKTVNARDLHAYLESKYQFTDWMNLFLPDFEQGVDYLVFQEKLKNPKGGRPREEYAISLDMAKHIALMSRTDKGREVRRYFIECEQRLKTVYTKDTAWLQARQDGKVVRREETDTIKLFVEYATGLFLNIRLIGVNI